MSLFLVAKILVTDNSLQGLRQQQNGGNWFKGSGDGHVDVYGPGGTLELYLFVSGTPMKRKSQKIALHPLRARLLWVRKIAHA